MYVVLLKWSIFRPMSYCFNDFYAKSSLEVEFCFKVLNQNIKKFCFLYTTFLTLEITSIFPAWLLSSVKWVLVVYSRFTVPGSYYLERTKAFSSIQMPLVKGGVATGHVPWKYNSHEGFKAVNMWWILPTFPEHFKKMCLFNGQIKITYNAEMNLSQACVLEYRENFYSLKSKH